jgi:hypothetical protein
MPGLSYTAKPAEAPKRHSVPYLIGYLSALKHPEVLRAGGLTTEDRETLQEVIDQLETIRYREVDTPQSTHNEGSFS